MTLRAEEVRDSAEHFQHYGFSSVPLPGAEGIGLAVGGSTDHMVVINIDDRRYRKRDLLPGEVCIYTRWGDYVLIREGEIVVKHATKVTVDAPLVHFTGNVTVDGSIVAAGDVTGVGTSLHSHVHGGVSSGASNTGAPA